MLKVESLSAFYGHIEALKGVSLEVREGEVVTVIGTNGAGKSTLLAAIAGLVPRLKGTVTFSGKDITGRRAERVVADGVTLVPEGRQIFAPLSVMENLEIGGHLLLKKRRSAEFKENLGRVFELFPVLAERGGQTAGTLSGGEQQMLAIGRALMTRPRLLMLDEPSMGLAPKVTRSIFDRLRALNQEGLTILLVEQDARIALAMADRGYVFQTGQVVLTQVAQKLIDDPLVKEIYFGKRI